MAKPALGRGLGALLGNSGNQVAGTPPPASAPGAAASLGTVAAHGERVQQLALDRIRPSLLQPRKEFPPGALQELADSIREQGIIQPLIARESGGYFELIAGERRWRAAKLAGLTEVPVIVKQADDRVMLEMALIENLQRENLNPLEEAQGYAELVGKFELRQEEVAAKVGKSRAVIANSLRLLKLPHEIQDFLRDGRLTVGHAKVILALDSPDQQKRVAQKIIGQGLNVRQTEVLVAAVQLPAIRKPGTSAGPVPDANTSRLEDRLRERLGTKVQFRYRGGQGSVEIRFFSDAELERILQILGISPE